VARFARLLRGAPVHAWERIAAGAARRLALGRPGGETAAGVVSPPFPPEGEGLGERGCHQNALHPLAGEGRPGGETAL